MFPFEFEGKPSHPGVARAGERIRRACVDSKQSNRLFVEDRSSTSSCSSADFGYTRLLNTLAGHSCRIRGREVLMSFRLIQGHRTMPADDDRPRRSGVGSRRAEAARLPTSRSSGVDGGSPATRAALRCRSLGSADDRAVSLLPAPAIGTEDAQRNPQARGSRIRRANVLARATFKYKTVPHITLKSIAQQHSLDPIFAKHEPILAARPQGAEHGARTTCTHELRQKLSGKLAEKQKARRQEVDHGRRPAALGICRRLQWQRMGGAFRHRPRLAEAAAGRA